MNYRRVVDFPEDAKAISAADTGSVAQFGPGHLANMLWVGGSGDVVLVKGNDETVTMKGVTFGKWHKMPPFKRVNSTDTSATDLVAGITFRM